MPWCFLNVLGFPEGVSIAEVLWWRAGGIFIVWCCWGGILVHGAGWGGRFRVEGRLGVTESKAEGRLGEISNPEARLAGTSTAEACFTSVAKIRPPSAST